MFSLFRPKRYDPEAIARAVLKTTRDPDLITLFWKRFTSFEKPIPARLLFSMVIFAYCWARGWSSRKNDIRVSAAWEQAAPIIALQFRDAATFVRVSDYVVSPLEMAELACHLIDRFREQISLNTDPAADIRAQTQANLVACRAYQIRLETLITMVTPIRNERMIRELSDCHTSNLDEWSTLMTLADTLYEQITGAGPLDWCRDPNIMTEGEMSYEPTAARAEVMLPLISRLDTELEAL
jgi:hypothetical protein